MTITQTNSELIQNNPNDCGKDVIHTCHSCFSDLTECGLVYTNGEIQEDNPCWYIEHGTTIECANCRIVPHDSLDRHM